MNYRNQLKFWTQLFFSLISSNICHIKMLLESLTIPLRLLSESIKLVGSAMCSVTLTWLHVSDWLIFGTLKDCTLKCNSLALNHCFSCRNAFQNCINTQLKLVLNTHFLSKSSKFVILEPAPCPPPHLLHPCLSTPEFRGCIVRIIFPSSSHHFFFQDIVYTSPMQFLASQS